MSKETDLIRRLVEAGWSVNANGTVLKPSGEIRKCYTKKGQKNRPPYRVFNVKDDGLSRPVHVHKMVAFLKFGAVAFDNLVRHLNNKSLDNSWNNIAIGSNSDNMMDRPAEERKAHALKAVKVLRKFTVEQVIFIRRTQESGKALAKYFNVSPSTISGIRNRKTYQNV